MSDAPTGSSPEAADTRTEAIEAGARGVHERDNAYLTQRGLTPMLAWDDLPEGPRNDRLSRAAQHYDAMAPIIERAACERHRDAMVTLSAGHVRAMGEARAERDKAVEQARVEAIADNDREWCANIAAATARPDGEEFTTAVIAAIRASERERIKAELLTRLDDVRRLDHGWVDPSDIEDMIEELAR